MADPATPSEASFEEPKTSSLGTEDRMARFKRWFKSDQAHSEKWRKDARTDYDFVAGEQWEERDRDAMEAQGKVPIQFNRTLSIIKSVAGAEINNRHEVKFLPRGMEDVSVNEVLNAGSQWMADNCDAEDEESESFEDCLICGMGWTENRLDYETDPEGKYIEERIDPLEMYWDSSARKKNLGDARRVWRVRRISLEEAKSSHPNIPDEELDAKWVYGVEDSEAGTPIEQRRFHKSGLQDDLEDIFTKKVTVVHAQWWEREPYTLMLGPNGQTMEVERAKFNRLKKEAEARGIMVRGVNLTRRRYKQAFIGNTILEEGDAPCGDHFSFQCITGERDRNKGTFFGLVKIMRDPQMWANKWLSQALHIMNTTANGGIMAEKSAFDNQRAAEDSWAHPNRITWLKDNALSSGQRPKVQEKPSGQFPAGFYQLVEFAVSSIRDVTGVNLELLGNVDRNQPGILEAQRKQAAMTILATMFNNLRRFRKQIGRIRLFFIQNYFSDGRMIRVTGPEGAKGVPLLKEETLGKYDVIVDDSPTSPNQKEATWNAIINILPAVRDMVTPGVALMLLKYSPLPESLVNDIEQASQQEQDDPETAQAKLNAIKQQIADIEKTLAQAHRDEAEAVKTEAETAQIGTLADPNVQHLVEVAQGPSQPAGA